MLADKLTAHRLLAGSLVAPVWGGTGGGSAMGNEEERGLFLKQVRKACVLGGRLRDLGVRKYGVIRIDSAASPAEWMKDPEGNTKRIAQTFREAGTIALASAKSWRRKAKSAGPGCIAGGAMCNCWKWSACLA